MRMLSERVKTPVTMGSALRSVVHEWSIRHVEFVFGHYFDNARALFFSGMANHKIARVLNEFTDNLVFADPLAGKRYQQISEIRSGSGTVCQWGP